MKAAILLAATISLLFSSVSLVLAGDDSKKYNVPFYITSPTQGTVYKGGERVIIQWINGIHGPVKLRLLQGTTSENMEVVTRYQTTLDGDIGSYKWTVPFDLPSKDKYAFQFVYPKRNKSKTKATNRDNFDYSYSGSFRILDSSNGTIYTATPSLTRGGYSASTSTFHAITPGYTHPISAPPTPSRHEQQLPSSAINPVGQQEGSASHHPALSMATLSISIFGIIFAYLFI